jgi:excinuclease ABC subunit C
MAESNGEIKLKQYLSNTLAIYQRLTELKELLHLKAIPQRIECFDVSHSSGDATVASCVAFGSKGPIKNQYRKFNVRKAGNDDYASLEEAIERHFMRILKEKTSLSEVLIIDGGKGQLRVASQVLHKLNIDNVFLLAIAKGKERKVGAEQIYAMERPGAEVSLVNFNRATLLLNFLLKIRDEAHRFAITSHRQRLTKNIMTSALENIAGVGKKRRDILLKQFGGIENIKAASLDELASVKGINKKIAKLVYDYLHS